MYVESYFEMRTLLLLFLTCFYVASSSSSNFEISWNEEMKNGRVRLYFSQAQEDGSCDTISEPRSSCDDTQNTTQVFGADVYEKDTFVQFDDTVLGYPLSSLQDIPSGQYCVQADLFPYITYHRGDGYDLILPKSCVSDAGDDGTFSLRV